MVKIWKSVLYITFLPLQFTSRTNSLDVETHIFDSLWNPLSAEMMVDALPTAEEEQLIYVSSNTSLKIKFPTMSLHKFLISVQIRAKL